jgi:hypothetical protein
MGEHETEERTEETEERTEETEGRAEDTEGRDDEASKAEQAKERYEKAQETMHELEERDEPPTELSDWPDDDSKYITYGGTEGDKTYDEEPTSKLGPHDLERHEDGSVSIEGEKVDNPDDYKGEPIPGGPTDPDAPKLAGEEKKEEKQDRQESDS